MNKNEEKQIAKRALQSLTRLRQGINPFNTDKLQQFFADQKIYDECINLLNIPKDWSIHSLRLIYEGKV